LTGPSQLDPKKIKSHIKSVDPLVWRIRRGVDDLASVFRIIKDDLGTAKELAMPWILLAIAGGLEVIWAHGLSEHHGYSLLLPSLVTVAALLSGFGLLAWALRSFRHRAAAALCTIIGALDIVLTGAFWLNQGMSPSQIGCIMLITGGIVSLQFIPGTERHASDDR
jgi:quaternary ammonium compound-resistance protein SugE